ncbi:MAG: hypothetical protein JNG53_01050 [Senegalimassilia sp.]|nr:hypothetical protein [Senegalimassilia sp.]
MASSLLSKSRRASEACAYLAVAAAATIGLWAVSMGGGLFGPDARYMVAAGRWILENARLPQNDPLTLHAQLPYICQQWPVCIVLALVHDLMGEVALGYLFEIIDVFGALALFSVSRRVGLKGAVPTALTCATVFWMSVMEGSTPRALDVICITLCWRAAARYLETRDPRILATFPLMGFLIANIHGALWPCSLMLPLSMLIDARLDMRSHGHLVIAAVLTICACMLNPYGVSMLALPFLTVGSDNPMLAGVWELRPMVPGFPGEATFTLGSCVAVLALTAKRGGSARLFSYGCAMTVGLAALSLMTRRNFLLYLAVLVLVSGEFIGMEKPQERDLFKDDLAARVSVLMAGSVLVYTVFLLATAIGNVSPGYVSQAAAFDVIQRSGVDSGSPVLTDLDTGCEAELMGYRPTLDTRVEVLCGVYGGHDPLTPAAVALSGQETAAYCEKLGIVAAVLPDGYYDTAISRLHEAGWAVVHDDGKTIALVSPSA